MGKQPSFARQQRRDATREAVADGKIAPGKRNLTPQETLELQEMHRICAGLAFQANQVKANTALIPPTKFLWFTVPRGKSLAAELEAQARLMDQVKRKWIGERLAACGYLPDSKCDINLSTGTITPSATPDEPRNDQKTS